MKTITDEPIISTWQARSLLALMDAFYSNPENVKAFEKWKKEIINKPNILWGKGNNLNSICKAKICKCGFRKVRKKESDN